MNNNQTSIKEDNGSSNQSNLQYIYLAPKKIEESLKEKLLRLKEYKEQGIPHLEIRTQEGISNLIQTLNDSTKIEVKAEIDFDAFSVQSIIPKLYYYQDLGNNHHYLLLIHSVDGENANYTHLTSDINQPLLQNLLKENSFLFSNEEKLSAILADFKIYEEKQHLNKLIKPTNSKHNDKNKL